MELKVKATDNAGNTNSEIILKPGITLEETLTPITMPKDFVASIETEGHPETAVQGNSITVNEGYQITNQTESEIQISPKSDN